MDWKVQKLIHHSGAIFIALAALLALLTWFVTQYVKH